MITQTIKGAPFRFKESVNVEHCRTAKDVIEHAKLNYNVDKCKLAAFSPKRDGDENRLDGFVKEDDFYIHFPNNYATYRTDTNVPLGTVKGKYTTVQNIEAFNFFDKAIGKDKAIWQTAGISGQGERIFVSAKLPKNIYVNGDPIENYLIFTNSHDGTSGVKMILTPIRLVCMNALNAAIRHSTNYVSFRHTKSIHDNMDIANEILGICDSKLKIVSDAYNAMNKIKMNDDEAIDLFSKVILSKGEQDSIKDTGHTIKQIIDRDYRAIDDSGISMKKVNTICMINEYYVYGVGQSNITGTAFGAYNAITGFYSNIDNSEGIKRMDTLLYGDRANKIKQTSDLILN